LVVVIGMGVMSHFMVEDFADIQDLAPALHVVGAEAEEDALAFVFVEA
jgi:hypothetical protein